MIYFTAVDHLKKWFSNTEDDTISLTEVYQISNRDLEKEEANKTWLRNKLTHLKRYDLVRPIYITKNNYEVLGKIQLTPKGKKAIGRSGGSKAGDNIIPSNGTQVVYELTAANTIISLDDVMHIVNELKNDNKDNIILDFNLKQGIVSVRMVRD